MSTTDYDNITIALAGILQAITLVREISHTGKTDEQAYQASIYSLFQTDAKDVNAVYGGLAGVKLGLERLIASIESQEPVESRYLLSIIHLQKKISRSPKMLATISERLAQAKKQVDYFSLLHPTVIANLADIYVKTISTFKFKIIIVGIQRVLHVRENLDKVRALLLAGLRSAVLWRQMGGSRWQLLFYRHRIKASAEKLLGQINTDSLMEKDIL